MPNVILQLLDSGDLTGDPRPGRQTPGGGSQPSGKLAVGRTAASKRRDKEPQNKAPALKDTPPESKADFPEVSLGTCPLCKASVVEQEKSFRCRDWRNGCKFAIWKTIAGKRISARTAQALLRNGDESKAQGLCLEIGPIL